MSNKKCFVIGQRVRVVPVDGALAAYRRPEIGTEGSICSIDNFKTTLYKIDTLPNKLFLGEELEPVLAFGSPLYNSNPSALVVVHKVSFLLEIGHAC